MIFLSFTMNEKRKKLYWKYKTYRNYWFLKELGCLDRVNKCKFDIGLKHEIKQTKWKQKSNNSIFLMEI